ncbi:MAG: hypothetical protein ACXWE0_11385, partial [Nitrososphaeraceae archaeon]
EKKLTPYNFKYNKGRQAFIKKAGEYEIEIELPKYFGSIEYDDNSGLIYLVFNLYTSIRIPNYSKWYEKNFGNKFNFSSSVSHIKLFTTLEFSDFSESDFFTPSKAVAFKNFVSGTLRNNMTSENKPEFIDFSEFLLNIEHELEKLKKRCNADEIFGIKDSPISTIHANYLIYANQLERAKSLYNQTFDVYIDYLTKENDPQSLKSFEKFIEDAERLLQVKYDNPFLANLVRTEDKTVQIELIPGYKYTSQLKFEAENFKLREGLYNETTSECFLLLDNNTLYKLNAAGEKIFHQKIEIGATFNHRVFERGLSLIKNSNCLIFDNYIFFLGQLYQGFYYPALALNPSTGGACSNNGLNLVATTRYHRGQVLSSQVLQNR